MHHSFYRSIWFLTILAALTLGCGFITDLSQKADDLERKAQSIATDVENGRELVATVQMAATQVLANELVQTAQAVVTEQAPRLLATAEAFATEQGPGLKQTAEAFAAEQGPGLVETAQGVINQAVSSGRERPPDIPVSGGEKEQFFESEKIISYLTQLSFDEVVAFYTTEMPLNGWDPVQATSIVAGELAILTYEKPERSAQVTIKGKAPENFTAVLITLDTP